MTSRFAAINADQIVTPTDRLLNPSRRWREQRLVRDMWLLAPPPPARARKELPPALLASIGWIAIAIAAVATLVGAWS